VESIVVTVLVIAGIVLWTRVSSLRQSLDRIERELKGLKPGTAQVPASPVAPAPSTPAAPTAPLAPSAPVARPWPVPSSAQELRKLREVEPPRVTAPQVPGAPSMYDRIESAVRGYFTGGNLVVRVGIIVLFFGVAFLLKYAAEHSNISIQMRLTGVALGAVALFVVGWRLRHRRRGFSLALQGGAIGVLYLTLFAALHLYQLLPASLTFALMAGLGIASCLLAVRQDSLAFSLLGATGGFLAPLLASTGSGSHVMLFSYYALLDAFVVWQAWFKAWRPLNLLAFIFTFGIGAYWGVTNYDASQFATTEPFLLFFFLAFVAIAVLFAFRRAPQLTHYVDGTLVFGTPLIASALQMHLVRDFTHGRAISALGAGVFYLALAAWLHRTRRETLKLLMESFLALGVAFLTLAVPLWFDDVWTAATWALEGAAVFWVGMRQQRKLASAFGVLLQLAAAVTFLGQASAAVARWPVVNAQCAGALLLSAAGLISARTATRPGEMLKAHGQVPANLLLAWGLGWWLYAGHHEIHTFVFHAWQPGALLALYAFTALACGSLVRPLNWPALRVPALLILPVMVGTAYWWSDLQLHPSSSGGWLVWPASLAVLWLNLRRHESSLPDRVGAVLHGVAAWLLGLLLSWELGWQVAQIAPETVWAGAAWALAPMLLLATITSERAAHRWPLRSYPLDFRGWVALGLSIELVVWALWLNANSDGSAAPLPYLPILNPLDIATALALWTISRWLLRVCREGTTFFPHETQRWMVGALVAVTFCWLNAVLFRTMHHWHGIPYRLHDLLSDTSVQAALSIFWSLLALGAMLWANRSGQRVVWFGAAALMAVVVVKLFLVDLAHIGTVARIVSFLVVGGLMLVIGYFSPLPPAAERDALQRPK
jgi:uncharacterized membrane protein